MRQSLQRKFAPGMRVIIRDEEWLVKKVETNSFGNATIHAVGLSPLVKDTQAKFWWIWKTN